MSDLNTYYREGDSYEAYKQRMVKEISEKAHLSEYTALNEKRMKRLEKTFKLSDEQIQELGSLPSDFKAIVITEGWCGDASQSIPVFEAIFGSMNVPIRYVYRDDNMTLMNAYLTNGASSIPILIALDKEGKELFRYGPRPIKGMEMLAEHKANPNAYLKDDFYKDLQQFYNKDKGKSIYDELVEIIKSVKV